MRFAEVSVNSPIAQSRTFSYRLPEGLNLTPGQAVQVPFGVKVLQGVVMELTEFPGVPETREISGLIEERPLLTPAQVALARWLSEYYLAPLFESVALMLPPGFERRVITYLSPESKNEIPVILEADSQSILDFIQNNFRVTQTALSKTFGSKKVQRVIAQLVRLHLVKRSYDLEKPRVQSRIVPHYRLKISAEEAVQKAEMLAVKAARQSELLRLFSEQPQLVPQSEITHKWGISSSIIQAVEKRGWLEMHPVKVDRDPLAGRQFNLSLALPLSQPQEAVFRTICAALHRDRSLSSRTAAFLLHGVTGSGKTEIYLRVLAETVKQGKRGLVLVPEIAMTPQIIERFVSRFPGRVAVLHSQLSLGEQFDEWWKIRRGEFDVVIGPRSALFAPQPDLGLIILDEEHEWTYKQADAAPRYHSREAALKLAETSGAVLVLGSATPDVESYFRAQNGTYCLLELNERISAGIVSSLPAVEVVDLRDELKAGNLSLFSRSLHSAAETALNNREQIILFLNRRGGATFVECRRCGYVVRCKRCEVPLSYHFTEERLICHQCNYHTLVPQSCPRCRSFKIKYLGVGTEKLEHETAKIFPRARILRWDSDSVRENEHQAIFEKFKKGEADILIGTQMVAKGLDLPGVTLVGVISADVALNLPDFRAGERAFQLLSQVSGRAGRGTAGGKVIFQTYSPEHYAVQAAAAHDYRAFYQKEIVYRRELRYPPFYRLARLVFTHNNDQHCREEAERMRNSLLAEIEEKGLAGYSLIGPAPAFYHRLRGRFHWQLILRAADPTVLLKDVRFPMGWTLDIDPVGAS
jgi:primosomal protein N' (replication factor Y) (superfamily II helicase)